MYMYEQLLPILSVSGSYVNTILLIIHQHYSHKNPAFIQLLQKFVYAPNFVFI